MSMFAAVALVLAITSSDAIATLLNLPTSCSARRYAEAKKQVLQDAAEGKPLQQYVIGVTTDDKAPASEKERARRYCEASRERIRALAVKTDNALAWYLLSMETNDMPLLARAARGGNVQALNAFGLILTADLKKRTNMPPELREQEFAKCYECFRRAAAQGDANGFINMGTCYLYGMGCKSDPAMAYSCFKAAAELGHPEAMDNLSAAYQLGHGIPPDEGLSLYWKMRGRAARGDEAAQKWLKEQK